MPVDKASCKRQYCTEAMCATESFDYQELGVPSEPVFYSYTHANFDLISSIAFKLYLETKATQSNTV